MTYAEFHLLFVVPPLVFLTAGAAATRGAGWRVRPWGVALIAAIAIVYTAPWDNYLIARGVWGYGEGSVAATL
ncbi:MAG: lycopene cyclase domain-containing protein, partial [Actinobacteria bacterium]|nr:lycopene cyclase domain-containing protein [Actinomycetota bacterium]NIU65699.1 lycopene cyclase domain-containing protein [Actinomycetota bacterium]NIW27502.1 lycopene cyclase domain-containing protein [Actinomycetota bacterium]NIX20014.1 lycopene cyclase domain-containing protein [Actinomycetota bacterium]